MDVFIWQVKSWEWFRISFASPAQGQYAEIWLFADLTTLVLTSPPHSTLCINSAPYLGFPSQGRLSVSHLHLISCLRKEIFFFFLIIESYKRESEKVFLIGSLNRYIVMSHCISLFAMLAYTWSSYCQDNGICWLAWPGAEGGLNSI